MKRSLYVVILAYLLCVFVQACKKYEDGPSFTLLTKKQRLAGDWLLKSVDGDPNLSLDSYEGTIYTSCGTEIPYKNETVYSRYKLEFEKDGDVEWNFTVITTLVDYYSTQATCTLVYNETEDSGLSKGDWEWEDKKEDIEITIGNERTEYEILKLTKDELKLETITGEIWKFDRD